MNYTMIDMRGASPRRVAIGPVPGCGQCRRSGHISGTCIEHRRFPCQAPGCTVIVLLSRIKPLNRIFCDQHKKCKPTFTSDPSFAGL